MEVLVFCLLVSVLSSEATVSETISSNVKIVGFFPPNLTDVTWAHAVNSIALLETALGDPDIMMLEADLRLGYLFGSTEEIPIMSHDEPYSDLSFQMFLIAVINFNNKAPGDGSRMKGIKLDTKQLNVVEPVLRILTEHDASDFEFPVWLNADILQGPINSTSTPVHAETFLNLTTSYLPEVTLSVGWKTRYGTEGYMNGSYTLEHANEMIDMLISQKVSPSTPITYPVRAGLATQSIHQLVYLVERSENFWKNSTITIWHGGADPPLDLDQLKLLVNSIGRNRCFVDLPFDV